ncbi:MAG: methionyl-tRNA formyltransferase [Deltaproteobacteria bacterium]
MTKNQIEPWRIIFMGTPSFAISSLEGIAKKENVVAVFTQPDRPKGRGQKKTSPPIKEIAQKLKIPCFQPESLKSEPAIREIERLSPDLIVVVAYGLFLPKKILDIPKYKVINVHPSLLPKYRGAAPMQWALINGDKETGVTIAYIIEKMDAGDILMQKSIDIDDSDDYFSLEKKLSNIGSDLLSQTISFLRENKISPRPQNEKEATFAPKLRKEMGRINWQQPARFIFNLIRGANPWPGTFTLCDREPLKIHHAKLLTEEMAGIPGKIQTVSAEGISVETPKGVLLLTEVQKPNKKRMPVSEFLKGNPITPGSCFHV